MGVLDNSNKYSNNNLNTYSRFKHQVDDLCPIESHYAVWNDPVFGRVVSNYYHCAVSMYVGGKRFTYSPGNNSLSKQTNSKVLVEIYFK